LLAQLALWTSSTNAFYPFRPSWLGDIEKKRALDSRGEAPTARSNGKGVTFDIKSRSSSQSAAPVSERAAREANLLAKKYDHDVAKRQSQNQFDVMEAEDPSGDASEGIDQDGTDYSYFIQVQLGSEGKELRMLIDTGAGNSWVMGSDCSSEACSLHDSFGPDDSDTFEASDEDFSVSYGTGKVSGYLATDTITVGGTELEFQFGIADETSDDFKNFVFDGILGLASTGDNEKFMDVLSESGDIDAGLFAVSLHRAADGDTNDGEISFGYIDEDRYEGDITYTDLGKDNGEWAIELEDASYDGSSASVGGVLAYIDTGTTFIFGPEDLVEKLHSVVPNAASNDGLSYKVPCDSKSLVFTFSGTDFEVSPMDWISPPNENGECTSNVYGQEVVEGSWLLGAAFIKNVYTVFDQDKGRIGFAQHPEEETATTTTSELQSSFTTASSVSTATAAEVTTTGISNDTSSRPSMGLGGEETDGPSETSSSDDSERTGEPDESESGNDSEDASAVNAASGTLAFSVCIATVFALLV